MKILKAIGYTISALAVADLAILMTGLAQVAQGSDVYFSPFWRVQAEFIINLVA